MKQRIMWNLAALITGALMGLVSLEYMQGDIEKPYDNTIQDRD